MLDKPGSHSTEAMDSWAMGCFMLELLTGEDNLSVVNSNVKTQLHMIDDVLGFSCKQRTRKKLPPGAQRRGRRQQTSRLRGELVPSEVLSDDGFEVLQGLLSYSPETRPTRYSFHGSPTTLWMIMTLGPLRFLIKVLLLAR